MARASSDPVDGVVLVPEGGRFEGLVATRGDARLEGAVEGEVLRHGPGHEVLCWSEDQARDTIREHDLDRTLGSYFVIANLVELVEYVSAHPLDVSGVLWGYRLELEVAPDLVLDLAATHSRFTA